MVITRNKLVTRPALDTPGVVSLLSLRVYLTPPNKLCDAAEYEGEYADHAEAGEEGRRSHGGPVAEHGAAGTPSLAARGDERETKYGFDRRLDQRERWGAPDPLVKRVARKVDRRERKQDYRDRYERSDERMPVQLFAVSVGDNVQHSHDDSSNDRHLDQ